MAEKSKAHLCSYFNISPLSIPSSLWFADTDAKFVLLSDEHTKKGKTGNLHGIVNSVQE